ncbi:MAG: 3-octaprenyl-4-hydroxybenzoate carboxy-lyase [Sulfuricurvum sp. PC08-66]|nr:MAG: 3-octaprenyl-4-hydroxybenzoate carboxy-lyase [Sulfuricurvum sp. PC08-66]
MKIVVAVSGASGASLGLKLIDKLPKTYDIHLVLSEHAQVVLEKEEHVTLHDNSNIAASIASGSFGVDAMMVVPCSMNTLAKIAHGIADNLITRAAAVMLKERKKLLLAPREMPFSPIALENMLKLATYGVIIAPPIAGFYSEQKNLEDMENFIMGRWLDQLDIPHTLYKRWS